MPLPDLLQWVAQSRQTGTLVIEGKPFSKKIYFREGNVVASSSENPKEFLGYFLVGWGHVEENELQELLDMQDRHGALLGELLVIIGRMTREELAAILEAKTEESVYEMFMWDEAEFRFLSDILPGKKFESLDLSVDMLIMEGVRRRDEWIRSREVIGADSWVPRLVRAPDVRKMDRASLSILRGINGTNSIEDIALENKTSPFFVLQFVYQGIQGGLFEVAPGTGIGKPIPGLGRGSWRTMLQEAESAFANEDYLTALSQLESMMATFGGIREAREQAAGLESKIKDAKIDLGFSDDAVLELAIAPEQMTEVSCSPEEGYLMSRVNGAYTVAEILKMLPASSTDHRLTIHALVKKKVIRVKPV